MARRITNNERAATKILDALNDHTLDTEMVGLHIFQFAPMDLYCKLDEVLVGVDKAIEAEAERVRKRDERRREKPPF